MSLIRTRRTPSPVVAPIATADDRWASLVPVAALAYPTFLQPLTNFRPPAAYARLSELQNVAGADSNIANQIFWLALLAAGLFRFRRRLGLLGALFVHPAVLLIATYLAVAALSVSWASAPDIALRRLVLQTVVISITVCSIFLTANRERILNGMVLLASAIVVVNLLFVAAFPPGRLGYLGIYSNKNILGLVGSLCFLFLAYGALVRQRLSRVAFLGLAVLALLLVALSQSKTSLGFVLIAPIMAASLLWLQGLLRIHMLALVLAVVFAGSTLAGLFSQISGMGFDDLSLALLGDDTFTGRTQIWSFVLGVYERSPYVGTGYASFWGTGINSVAFLEAPGFIVGLLQAHNGYLDVLLETGLLGFAVLVAMILASLNHANPSPGTPREVRWLALSIMLFVVFHNLLESSWFRAFSAQWLAFVVATALMLPPPFALRSKRAASPRS
ncbi:O-antigen ligase [Aureimonas pseudogalii]|uniref:O-antigen ligase n=1 Tax=Aureimonas pseudogalii TaxID=1744844 RepID=A0A7W6EFU1_9HYPH|nr:O-antigen ligase [Aureimonas pseudogalii]